jgi:sec-independent protein translocase protein TatA
MPSAYFGDILGLGTPELIIILVILVLLFGAKKLPELAKSIGNSTRELKNGLNGDTKTTTKSAKPDVDQEKV